MKEYKIPYAVMNYAQLRDQGYYFVDKTRYITEIANVLYKRKVLESWGRGISLMMNECRRVGLPEPEFHTNGNFVWVVFRYTMQAIDQVKDLLYTINSHSLSAKEIMERLSFIHRPTFRLDYLHPALSGGFIAATYPEQPNHPKQKYYLTDKGKSLVKQK